MRTQTREGRARNWVGFGLPHGGQIRRRNWRTPITTHMPIPTLRANLPPRRDPPEGGERRSPKGIVRSYEKRGVEDLRVVGPLSPRRGVPVRGSLTREGRLKRPSRVRSLTREGR